MLATVEELKRHLHTAGTVTSGAALDDALLGDLLAAASDRMQEERPERTLEASEPIERRFYARRVIQVPDLREVVSIRFDDLADDVAATDYELVRRREDHPALWVHLHAGVWVGRRRLVIVGRWGPADSSDLNPKPSVKHAALVWASRAFHNRTARYADTLATPDGGIASYFRQLPPDVLATVNALAIPGV